MSADIVTMHLCHEARRALPWLAVTGDGDYSGPPPNSAGAQGVGLPLTLPAGIAAYKGAADVRTQGTTT